MVFHPAPSLTVETVGAALAAGLQAIAAGQHTIDFAGVTRVDSAAVALLLAWQRAAQAGKFTLVCQNMPPMLSSLSALYGVADLLPPATPAA